MVTLARQTGNRAEALACQLLLQHGLRLVSRNWFCPAGEIDLIMTDADDIVFVEVRSRKSSLFGSAAESIDAPKRRRLIRSAGFFLQRHTRFVRKNCRFDIVAFCGNSPEWIKNAFDADDQ